MRHGAAQTAGPMRLTGRAFLKRQLAQDTALGAEIGRFQTTSALVRAMKICRSESLRYRPFG